MKKLLILCLTFTFATELEVDGNLKVTGSVDASGNAIKNVGPPTALTDAINAETLQNTLRNDGPFEYKMFMTRLEYCEHCNEIDYYEFSSNSNATNSSSEWTNDFHNILLELFNESWIIDTSIEYLTPITMQNHAKQLIILKRPLEDSE